MTVPVDAVQDSEIEVPVTPLTWTLAGVPGTPVVQPVVVTVIVAEPDSPALL